MSVTAVKIKINFILGSDLLLCASFWSKRHSCDRKVETVFFFSFFDIADTRHFFASSILICTLRVVTTSFVISIIIPKLDIV